MSENVVQSRIRLALGKLKNVKMFRNNCGEAWLGKVIEKTDTTVTILRPIRVVYGLMPGSADLIGWTSVVITPDMVGRTMAVFTAQEVKVPGLKAKEHQQNFINAVNAAGGIAGTVHNDAEALALVRAS